MSSSWWANQVGTAATATTPTGTVPRYGLAYDVGTAPWTPQTFRLWQEDAARESRAQDIAQAEAKAEEQNVSYFNQLFAGAANLVTGAIGKAEDYLSGDANPFTGVTDEQRESGAETLGEAFQTAKDTPVVGQVIEGLDMAWQGAATPFILDRNTTMKGGELPAYSMWFSSDAWAEAWREADDRSPGQAIVEAFLVGPDTTTKDLDRLRRTNSLYGLASLGIDLVAGFKLDPTVLGAKAVGEARTIARGIVPRGQTSSASSAEARRVLHGEDYTGLNPARMYGAWRGKRILSRWGDVEKAYDELDYTDFQDLPMFRGRAVNGPQAAQAVRIALDAKRAGDETLWDLTKRAAMGDPAAWREISRLETSVPEDLQQYANADTRTYLDAIDATKTKATQLENEIRDLEKLVARRNEMGPRPKRDGTANEGFFKYHTWELDRDAELKALDLEDINRRLAQHEEYATWLRKIDENGGISLEQVSAGSNRFRALRQNTYHESPYSRAHTVTGIARAAYVREANPIDLHRVDSGTTSIRRQFEQYQHLFNYTDRDGLNDVLERFTRAPDAQARRMIAQEVELTHGLAAIQHAHPELSVETIDAFLKHSRERVDDMYDRLLSGDDAIYTTAPDGNGGTNVNLVDGKRKITANLPVDVTQLPSFYTPMDIRRVHLAIKREKDLFLEVDTAARSWARGQQRFFMDLADDVGSKFNTIWKPLQLFRLAWPQRVLIDEEFRSMAQLGAMAWARTTFPAAITATGNAVRMPLRLGYEAFQRRQKVKIGPGPLADELTGRRIHDVAGYEEDLSHIPHVPSYMAPVRNAKRAEQLDQMVQFSAQARRIRDKRNALLRNPNRTQSLPDDPNMDEVFDWTDIQALANIERWDDAFDGEDFTPADMILADTHLTTRELLDELRAPDSDGDIGGIADLLALTPGAQRRILDDQPSTSIERGLAELFGKQGSLRARLREEVAKAKRNTDAEIAHRKSGAGHGPLFPNGPIRDFHEYARRDVILARALGAEWAPASARGGAGRMAGEAFSLAPTLKQFLDADPGFTRLPGSFFDKTQLNGDNPVTDFVADPITGKEINTGYAVPVVTEALPTYPARAGMQDPREAQAIEDFITRNAELLSSVGYRVQLSVDDQGRGIAQVVRTFRSNERAKAADFASRVNAPEFRDIGAGHKRYVRDWTDTNPVLEQLTRQFKQELEGPVLTPGESPAKGAPPVFHGTHNEELPEDLLPRDEVEMMTGQMFGPGFYTTDSLDIAKGYAGEDPTRVYTIRDARTKKKYKVFDLHTQIDAAEKARLFEAFDEWVSQQGPTVQAFELESIRELIDGASDFFHLYWDIDDTMFSAGSPFGIRADEFLTNYLERQHGAGALTHRGGIVMGGTEHQVYIWLKPEELEVRPAFIPSDKFYLLEEWFNDPDMPSNVVPESRIDRTGPKPRTAAIQEQERADALGASFRQTEQFELDGAFDALEFNREIDNVHERFARRILKRKQFGKGTARFTTHDGEKVRADRIFEGAGENYVPLVSVGGAMQRLKDTYHRSLSMYRAKAVGHKRIKPPDMTALGTKRGRVAAKEYYGNWADLLNDQIRNSPIWFRMLEGQSNDEIVAWLRNTHEGKLTRDKLPHKGHDPEKWVEEHRQALDFYLPDENLQTLLRQEKLRPSDLRNVPDENLPEIFGPDLEMIDGSSGWGQVVGKWVDTIYHGLGTVPTDTLVRQPFAAGMYQLKMKNLISAIDAEDFTPEIQLRFEKQAREFALRQVRRTLYTLADESNFTQAVRFLAPFWGAQEEAITKWLGIMVERPETVARFYVGQDVVYENFSIIDEDGQPVTEPGDAGAYGLPNYSPNHRVVMQIPKGLRKLPWFKEALKYQGSVDTAIGSMNTAFQGDQPFLPSLGPIVAVPAHLLLKMREEHGVTDDDAAWYRWLFPVGRPADGWQGTMDTLFPGWARRASQSAQGQDSLAYANTYFSIYREMELDHAKRGLPPPTPKEVKEAAESLYRLRVVASFGMPFPMNFRPKHQLFLDEYHKMQQTYGPSDAFERFVKKYGVDMARFTASSSISNLGIPPTAQGMEEWTKHNEVMAKYPEWASAMVSPDAWADDFSSDAYKAQFELNVSEDSNEKLREISGTRQRLRDVDTRTGWLEFRQFMSAMTAELYARGFTSIDQSGAEAFAEYKKAFVNDLVTRNPAWGEDYRVFEDTAYARVNELQDWAFEKDFDNRPDIQGVRQYLMIRAATAQSLDQYAAATGGSRSLQATENTELRNWFYTQVGQLIQANPAFGEFYTRYLDSDNLTRGSGP